MNIEQARQINEEVRDFFKPGWKSSNKAYVPASPEDYIADEDMAGLYGDIDNAKWIHREVARQMPIPRLPIYEHYDGKGHDILHEKRNQRGNCTEMAYVAFRKVKLLGEPRENVMIGTITGRGDHVFCYVSSGGNPSLRSGGSRVTSVKQMRGEGIVIDPWMNIVCTAQNYELTARAKLRKWQQDGKRILVAKKEGGQSIGYWASPQGTYQTNFLNGTLVFSLNRKEHDSILYP
ncbi:MAG: hypothetical protein K6L76_06800 [Agarilytica sp.]